MDSTGVTVLELVSVVVIVDVAVGKFVGATVDVADDVADIVEVTVGCFVPVVDAEPLSVRDVVALEDNETVADRVRDDDTDGVDVDSALDAAGVPVDADVIDCVTVLTDVVVVVTVPEAVIVTMLLAEIDGVVVPSEGTVGRAVGVTVPLLDVVADACGDPLSTEVLEVVELPVEVPAPVLDDVAVALVVADPVDNGVDAVDALVLTVLIVVVDAVASADVVTCADGVGVPVPVSVFERVELMVAVEDGTGVTLADGVGVHGAVLD